MILTPSHLLWQCHWIWRFFLDGVPYSLRKNIKIFHLFKIHLSSFQICYLRRFSSDWMRPSWVLRSQRSSQQFSWRLVLITKRFLASDQKCFGWVSIHDISKYTVFNRRLSDKLSVCWRAFPTCVTNYPRWEIHISNGRDILYHSSVHYTNPHWWIQ